MSTRLLIGSFLMVALLAAPSAMAAPSGGACAFGVCPGFITTPFGTVIVCASGTLVGCHSVPSPVPLPAPIPGTPLGCQRVNSVAGQSLPGGVEACA